MTEELIEQDLPRVAVVMSTYNGEEHLAEQIDSILAQEGVAVSLFVRDDGSRDGTLDILRAYERRGELVLIAGENVGVVPSFIAGIAAVPGEFPFVALSDQDDIWHADKLARACALLAGKDQTIPQMYCSEYMFCDGEMNPTGRSHLNLHGVGFATSLYEVRPSGNTTVINRVLADMVAKAGAQDVYSHDWWLGLLATALGELTFDDFLSLDYRRIETSVSPTGSSGLKLLRYRIGKFLDRAELAKITAQLQRFYDLYADRLDPYKRALTERLLFGNRFAKAATPVRLRQTVTSELALRALFLAGLL